MSANRSTAVMQRRHEPHDSLDYFPTPPWATRALCERLMDMSPLDRSFVWEPACGEGHMAKPLGEVFGTVHASDVHDYSETFPDQKGVCDFLTTWDHPVALQERSPDWIITNPPFRLGEKFIQTALSCATVGCAVFVRTAFLEGKERHKKLFSCTPPALVLQFVERVPLVKGRLDQNISSATSYCWIVWLKESTTATAFEWIAPCRPRLERASDYPAPDAVSAPAPLLDASLLDTPVLDGGTL